MLIAMGAATGANGKAVIVGINRCERGAVTGISSWCARSNRWELKGVS